MFNKSIIFHYVVGTLWFVTAVITAVENPMFVGSVFWPPIIFCVLGVFFYIRATILMVKKRRHSRKTKQEINQ